MAAAVSRSERLLDLLQMLRRHRHPVSGRVLAEELQVSLRTLYRDIASLQAHGAAIAGEAGVGYVLQPGYLLPPLIFSEEEMEALVLGSLWVAQRADSPLSKAAQDAMAKIAAVVPEELKTRLSDVSLMVVPAVGAMPDMVDIAPLRHAIRRERKVAIRYGAGAQDERIIWPFALGYFERVRIIAAWCERRADFRHFRTDRILSARPLDERYPRRRQDLLKDWKLQDLASTEPLLTESGSATG